MEAILALPAFVLALLALLLVAQLALLVWALIDLVKRPAERVRGPKWLWVVVVIFGELIGPLVYLIFGRLPESVDVKPATPAPGRAAAAADVLYGAGPEAPSRVPEPVDDAGEGGTE